MTGRKVAFLAQFLLVLSPAAVAQASTKTAEVRGVVLYHNQRPAANCVVDAAGKFNYVDGNGNFRIFDVPTGDQNLKVTCGGHLVKEETVTIHAPVEELPPIVLP